MSADLNPRQQEFVRLYLKGEMTAGEAYIAAGYKVAKKSTADVCASQLLSHPKIAAEIERVKRVASHEAEVTVERWLREVGRLAFFDERKLYRPDGTLKHPLELDDATAAAIAGREVFEQHEGHGDDRRFVGLVKKWKVFDKNTALTTLGKFFGVLSEKAKVELTGKDGQPLSGGYTADDLRQMTLEQLRAIAAGGGPA